MGDFVDKTDFVKRALSINEAMTSMDAIRKGGSCISTEQRAEAIRCFIPLLANDELADFAYGGLQSDEDDPGPRLCEVAAECLVSLRWADTVDAVIALASKRGFPLATLLRHHEVKDGSRP